MTSDSARAQLIGQLRRTIGHVKAGTIPQTDDVMSIPVTHYTDPDRWQREVDLVFKRLPLMLGFSSELRRPGDYRAIEACGVPVIITRGPDDVVRSFVNMCSHRGAKLVEEGTGTTRRFVCPYHAWNYDGTGALVGVTNRTDFGDVDASCMGLTALPTEERWGLIWVVLSPDGEIDLDEHLGGYAEMLDHFDFGSWHVVGRRVIDGPNWKLAYDGYLDFYHLPFLHRETFGPDMTSRPIYDAWGPHQRMTGFYEQVLEYDDVADDDIPLAEVDGGVWTIFPHVSIAGFPVGERGLMVSQLFPGAAPDRSVTIQNYLTITEPDDELCALAEKQGEFFEHVVRDEDYFTGVRIDRNIRTGAKQEFVFGRNEGGGQRFHRHLDALVD